MTNHHSSVLVGPFRQLLTMAEMPLRGPLQDSQLQVITESGIGIENGIITL